MAVPILDRPFHRPPNRLFILYFCLCFLRSWGFTNLAILNGRAKGHAKRWTTPKHAASLASTRQIPRHATLLSSAATPNLQGLSSPLVKAVDSLIDKVQAALERQEDDDDDDERFVSLSLIGRSKRDVKEYLSRQSAQPQVLRGTLRTLEARLVQTDSAAASSSLLQLQVTFKYHLATDIVKNWSLASAPSRLRAILLAESSSSGDDENDASTAIVSAEWDSSCDTTPPILGSIWGIQHAILETTQASYRQNFVGTLRAVKKVTKQKQSAAVQQQKASLQHDRVKQGPLAAIASNTKDRTYLAALGLVTPDGQPRPKQSSKLRQCNKFVEIVSQLVQQQQQQQEHGSKTRPNDRTERQQQQRISILDMGCGRGYLTFALHDYLATSASKHHHLSDFSALTPPPLVRTMGIDVRPKLVQECNQIAQSLGAGFDGLIFKQGTIEAICANDIARGNVFDWTSQGHSSCIERLDVAATDDDDDKDEHTTKILIALHACDTATDDALWAGIHHGADIIVVAPCCHKQARPQLNQLARDIVANKAKAVALHHPLTDLLRHPIYRERLAETVTDSLRALLLELAGYSSVQVFEFIGGEHTQKNTMITAVRQKRGPGFANGGTTGSGKREELRQRIHELASFHGVHEHKLAELMGVSVAGTGSMDARPDGARPTPTRNMPPL